MTGTVMRYPVDAKVGLKVGWGERRKVTAWQPTALLDDRKNYRRPDGCCQ